MAAVVDAPDLFLAGCHAKVLSGSLVFSLRVAYPMYLCTPRVAAFSPLEEQ